jgi:hypothetical protein
MRQFSTAIAEGGGMENLSKLEKIRNAARSRGKFASWFRAPVNYHPGTAEGNHSADECSGFAVSVWKI